MAHYLNLQIPSACHEQWQNMTPDLNGRYCQSCQKTVVDFTGMSDDELVRFFQQNRGSSCGRFTDEQLNRDLLVPRKPVPWIKYFFRYSLPAFLLLLKGNVQAQVAAPKVEVSPIVLKDDFKIPSVIRQKISGYVRDESGLPLQYAYIVVKDARKGTITDSTGWFELDDVLLPTIIQCSYVGFEIKEKLISSLNVDNNINLELSAAWMGEVVVVGAVYRSTKRKKTAKALRLKKQEPAICKETASFVVYPNPIRPGNLANLTCTNMESGTYTIGLYSLSGQLLQSNTVQHSSYEKNISMLVGHVQPGIYTLRLVHSESGKQFTRQVLVKD